MGCPGDQNHRSDPRDVLYTYCMLRRVLFAQYVPSSGAAGSAAVFLLGAGQPISTCSAHPRERMGVRSWGVPASKITNLSHETRICGPRRVLCAHMPSYYKGLQGPQECSLGTGQPIFTWSAHPRERIGVMGPHGPAVKSRRPESKIRPTRRVYVARGECCAPMCHNQALQGFHH